MKTQKLKKIITLSCILLMFVYMPSFGQGLPGTGPDGDDDNVDDQVPIDQNLMAGLIGGCLIAGYFFLEKKKAIETK